MQAQVIRAQVMQTQLDALSVAARAKAHCELAVEIQVGQRAVTSDGHVVERKGAQEWRVAKAPAGSRYGAGAEVKSRVLFWRMNGLAMRVAA